MNFSHHVMYYRKRSTALVNLASSQTGSRTWCILILEALVVSYHVGWFDQQVQILNVVPCWKFISDDDVLYECRVRIADSSLPFPHSFPGEGKPLQMKSDYSRFQLAHCYLLVQFFSLPLRTSDVKNNERISNSHTVIIFCGISLTSTNACLIHDLLRKWNRVTMTSGFVSVIVRFWGFLYMFPPNSKKVLYREERTKYPCVLSIAMVVQSEAYLWIAAS